MIFNLNHICCYFIFHLFLCINEVSIRFLLISLIFLFFFAFFLICVILWLVFSLLLLHAQQGLTLKVSMCLLKSIMFVMTCASIRITDTLNWRHVWCLTRGLCQTMSSVRHISCLRHKLDVRQWHMWLHSIFLNYYRCRRVSVVSGVCIWTSACWPHFLSDCFILSWIVGVGLIIYTWGSEHSIYAWKEEKVSILRLRW